MGFAHQFCTLGIQKIFQGQRNGITDLFVGLYIVDPSFHQICMYHAHPRLQSRLISGDHHQFAAAGHLQRAVFRAIAFHHAAGSLTQFFHRADIHRDTFQFDMGHAFFKAGLQRTEHIFIRHALIVEIDHHVRLQGQRCNDIFQHILIIIFDQNFHGIPPLSADYSSTMVSSSNFTSGSLFLFLPLNTEPKFSLFTTPGAMSISFVMAS